MAFTASARTSAGGSWLTVAPASGTANPAFATPLTVTANPAGLGPGTYTGVVSLSGPANVQRVDVNVIMTVTAVRQTILLSQTGLTFTAVAGGGSTPQQTFGVLNIGQGVMAWSTDVLGANWLQLSPATGASDASSLDVPLVEAAVNAADLAPGEYYGQIRVSAASADNTPAGVNTSGST